jgi:hypothetical protein
MEHCCDEYSSEPSQSSYKLNNVRLEELSLLLQKYIDTNLSKELECINALQHFAFAREYPSGKIEKKLLFLHAEK